MNMQEFEKRALKEEEQNKKFLDWVIKKRPSDLDKKAGEAHEQTFQEIDCLKCANCCKTTSPIFYERDIDRASRALRMKPSEFIEKYLRIDEDKDYVLKSSPCAFLDHENYCLIYNDRPAACREYPHTNRKRLYQISKLTFTNTKVCPAALSVVERLRKNYGF